jgi:hypothetical protein
MPYIDIVAFQTNVAGQVRPVHRSSSVVKADNEGVCSDKLSREVAGAEVSKDHRMPDPISSGKFSNRPFGAQLLDIDGKTSSGEKSRRGFDKPAVNSRIG